MRPLGKAAKAALSIVASALFLFIAAAGLATRTVVPLGPFRSVTLRHGGEVTVRHASTQRVTLIKGTTDHSSLTIVGGGLVIDRCPGRCPEGYELEVEILTPNLDDFTVMDGGVIESRGSFPRQLELRVMVEEGGIIDLRAMTIDQVAAAVREGGRILAKPRERLVAEIESGGVVTYWGNPRVTSSVENGGAVTRGAAADANKPFHEFGPKMPAIPPIPPVPPVPPVPPIRAGESI